VKPAKSSRTRKPPADGLINVSVLFLDQSHASVSATACDVFRAAGTLWESAVKETQRPRFRITSFTIDGEPVLSGCGIIVTPHSAMNRLPKQDIVFIPDCAADLDQVLREKRALVSWLADQHAKGVTLAAACSGVALLAEAGLLKGRRATTHWSMRADLAARYPETEWRDDLLVTEDSNIFCSGGVYGCADLCLYLVEKFCDRETALQCARALMLDMPRKEQVGFSLVPNAARHTDDDMKRAEDLLQRGYHGDIRIEEIAQKLGMSPRNFERRFRAATGALPREYLQKLRIAEARRLLEDGARSIQDVANASGYSDIQFFRQLFKRHTGVSPADYRRRFCGPPLTVVRANRSSTRRRRNAA
jgi:transcriptional regulator GlxA family with amidase domain